MQENIFTRLRDKLETELTMLQNGEISLARAKVTAALAMSIFASYRIEVEHARFISGDNSPLLIENDSRDITIDTP